MTVDPMVVLADFLIAQRLQAEAAVVSDYTLDLTGPYHHHHRKEEPPMNTFTYTYTLDLTSPASRRLSEYCTEQNLTPSAALERIVTDFLGAQPGHVTKSNPDPSEGWPADPGRMELAELPAPAAPRFIRVGAGTVVGFDGLCSVVGGLRDGEAVAAFHYVDGHDVFIRADSDTFDSIEAAFRAAGVMS